MSKFTDELAEKLIEKKSIGGMIGIFLATILILIFYPFLNFWFAYFCGWIAKILIGKYIVAGFALINIDLPLDKIPLFAGVAAWVGGFFKSINVK